MPLRVLIVDDEAPARDRLERLLLPAVDRGEISDIDQAEDGIDALEQLGEAGAPYDVIFLDIQMPELDGFDVLERLPPEQRPAVVFTTAYDEYAVRAFEANAVDYLLKPVEPARLEDALARAQPRAGRDPAATERRLAALLDALDDASTDPPPNPRPVTQFTVQGHDRLVVVRTDEIVTAEVHDGITNLHVLSRESGDGKLSRHIVSFTLDTLAEHLDPEQFMRVHRGAIVAIGQIQSLVPWFSGRYKLVMTGGHEVTASRTRSRELRDRLSL